jgi:transcriptional regulator with XRE-family HTH domain
MSDVLIANPADDVFWPPTERTEAQAPEIAALPDAWIFGFLGSRVQSFSPGQDRVIVYCRAALTIDAWALGAKYSLLFDRSAVLSQFPVSWEPRLPSAWNASVAYAVFSQFGEAAGLFAENPPADADRRRPPAAGLEAGIATIKDALGLTDAQVESATGVSRSTLWRLRTGRTSGTRKVTEAAVWRLHALATALVRTLGPEGARGWLHGGEPSLAALLSRGDLAGVEQAADRIIFQDVAERRSAAAVAEDDYADAPPPMSRTAPSSRPPRRAIRPDRTQQ